MCAGDCLTIAAALAVNMPAYVLSEASDSQLLDCNWADSEHMVTDDSAPDVLHCSMPGLQALEQGAEAHSSCSAVMTGFATLLRALLNGAMQSADVKVGALSQHCCPAVARGAAGLGMKRWMLPECKHHVVTTSLDWAFSCVHQIVCALDWTEHLLKQRNN